MAVSADVEAFRPPSRKPKCYPYFRKHVISAPDLIADTGITERAMANNGMFRGKVSRTRAVLVAISTTLLIIYAVDFVLAGPLLRRAHRASSPPEFTLQLWGQEDAVYTADVGASLPMFEPKAGWWMLGADHLNDLSGHLRGLEIGPDGSHPSLIVRLPADATVGVYRRAIASLADQGI